MSSDQPPVSPARRHAITTMGAGLAMSAAAGVLAPSASAAGRPAADDLVAEHPKPPFPDQRQPWPALASRMNPRPDHGETSYRGSGRLQGRKALITGGDSGIGRAVAIAYAREGADVAINYLPQEEEDAREVVSLIRQAGRKAVAIPGDLREESFCSSLAQQASAQLGGLDILVNNAARQKPHRSIVEISSEDFDWTIRTNIYALFWLTRAAVPAMPAGSAIINTASVTASNGPGELLDYAGTKGFIVTFTKSLAKQLAEKRIRVNAVAPGPYWTPLQAAGGQLPGKLPGFGADSPMGRPGQPAEIAGLYVNLAEASNSYTTGNVFSSTGGSGDV
jgi:NAD(P)-dependent dehydrogenase (short-subunit alcohol dehydrogenase family)